ncbi:MAG: AAA family ATPase [Candidatus Omnitrophica bacterium]|nr:AAA family ATPase [Candidatus Omnitrophota bacterium]
MYLEHYGLKEAPFNITADGSLFFQSKHHKEALATLLYGIKERKGIISFTGEVGTGKTTLCKVLLKEIPKEFKTSLILNPYFSSSQLLRAIVEDFGIHLKRVSRLDMVYALNKFLIETAENNSNAVLIIDESQDLTAKQLEQIRLLSNLETEKHKLLQIILVGQPELKQKLEFESLRQIKQRISVNVNIAPLDVDEIKDYIKFRLDLVGALNLNFAEETFNPIYEFSKGIPRLINVLCDRALLAGFAKNKHIIDKELIHLCIQDLQ